MATILDRQALFRFYSERYKNLESEKNFSVVPQMWQDCIENGTLEKLSQMVSASPAGLLGISVCNDEEQWKYFIAIATSQENPEFEEYTVPATTWAIFPGTGTNQSVQELEQIGRAHV